MIYDNLFDDFCKYIYVCKLAERKNSVATSATTNVKEPYYLFNIEMEKNLLKAIDSRFYLRGVP